MPLVDLVRELERRGVDAAPAGVLGAALEEVEQLRAHVMARAIADEGMADGRAVVQELASLAGETLPAAVEFGMEQSREVARLRAEYERSELEASLLAGVALLDEISEMEAGSD